MRPGIDGISDTISVRSIVGRFLEHSRIFDFGNGATVDEDVAEPGAPQYFTGSADWMTRNLDQRVEAVTPIEGESFRQQLRSSWRSCSRTTGEPGRWVRMARPNE